MKTDLPNRLAAASNNLDPKGNYWVCPLLNEARLELEAFHALVEQNKLEIASLRSEKLRLEYVLGECQQHNREMLGHYRPRPDENP